MSGRPTVAPVERLDFRFEQRAWAFAETRRAEIDRHFAAARAAGLSIWNGRVLLLRDFSITDGVMNGAWFETDFASFLAWRDWGFPDHSVRNCFAMAALRSADGAFLLGVMASHTTNAGKVYFPSGAPEPGDLIGDTVDLEGSALRELGEETGLDATDVSLEPGWTVVRDRGLVALMKIMSAREDADALRQRVRVHLAAEEKPELADLSIVRPGAAHDPATLPVVAAFLDHYWR